MNRDYEIYDYDYEAMSNSRRSLFLIGCFNMGDSLEFEIGVFAPGLKGEQIIRSSCQKMVKISLDGLDTSQKTPLTCFNGEVKIIKD